MYLRETRESPVRVARVSHSCESLVSVARVLIVSWQRAGVPETLSPASFDEARRWEAEV